jgi:VWFA-related protein
VLVTDAAGAPVGGLRQQDFSLLDNGQPITPASFEASDGPTRADPPVEVILLLDETNNLLRNISYEQTDLMRFLRQNGGRLACPTTIMLFTEHGVQTEPHATTDGNALAADLGKTSAPVHMIPLSGGYEAIQRLQQSLRALSLIATAESSRPGRKLLIWIGPGWPLLESAAFQQSQQSQRADFNLLVDLTRRLQEARITLYQVNRLDPSSGLMFLRERYRSYLQPAASPRDFQMAALSLPVFVVHSGGLVQDTPGDFIAMLNRCIAEAQPYYTVRFNPTAAKQDSEYHAVTVRLSRPGLSARTWAGYYADPAPPH